MLNALKYGGGCLRFGPSFTITAALTDFLCVVVHGSVISVRDTTAAVSCVVIVLFMSRIVTNLEFRATNFFHEILFNTC